MFFKCTIITFKKFILSKEMDMDWIQETIRIHDMSPKLRN
jgi:hypothetical protein